MVGPLDGPDFAKVIDRADRHAAGRSDVFGVDVQAVVAGGVLDQLLRCVMQPSQARSSGDVEVDVDTVDGAGQERNDRRAAGSIFGMGRVVDSELGASMFYQNMLKAASSPHEGNTTLTGGPNHSLGCVGNVVRRTGANDDAGRQIIEPVVGDIGGPHDADLQVELFAVGCMLDRIDCRRKVHAALGYVEDYVDALHSADGRRATPIRRLSSAR